MAKGARASTKKANNVKLKSKVFGPVETDRTARLSAKLLALAAQPKPKPAEKDVDMDIEEAATEEEAVAPVAESKQTEAMEVDSTKPNSKSGKGEIKRRVSKRRSAIVFPKYNERSKVKKPKSKGKK